MIAQRAGADQKRLSPPLLKLKLQESESRLRGLPTKPLLTGWCPWRFQRYREDLGYQRSSGPGGERIAGGIDLQGFTVGGA